MPSRAASISSTIPSRYQRTLLESSAAGPHFVREQLNIWPHAMICSVQPGYTIPHFVCQSHGIPFPMLTWRCASICRKRLPKRSAVAMCFVTIMYSAMSIHHHASQGTLPIYGIDAWKFLPRCHRRSARHISRRITRRCQENRISISSRSLAQICSWRVSSTFPASFPGRPSLPGSGTLAGWEAGASAFRSSAWGRCLC